MERDDSSQGKRAFQRVERRLFPLLFFAGSVRKRLHQDDSLDAASRVWKLDVGAGLVLCRL